MATYSLDDLIAVLDTAIERFEAEMPSISEELATNAMALIVNRIQQEGFGKPYSTNKLPLFYFHDRALNAGGRNELARRQKRSDKKKAKGEKDDEYGMSYVEWRQANGLQVAHRDLTFTGRMFQNVQILGTTRKGNTWTTIMGATDKENKDKLRWNKEREGDFFVLHPEDDKIIEALANKRLTDLVNSLSL